MVKKFLLVMGIVFTGLIGSCVFALTGVGLNAAADAPHNKAVAAAVTRDLARAWDVLDLMPHFTAPALKEVNFSLAQQAMDPLKALGALRNIEDAQQTGFHYTKTFGGHLKKTATIVLIADFEYGRAKLTIQLANEGSDMKLLHVNVSPIGELRPRKQQA